MVRRIFIYIFSMCCMVAAAQHYQFSQFYAAPMNLNPAFTGANSCSKLVMNYRNQWSKIPGGFTTFQASYDKPLKQINSGLGASFFNDKAGPGGLQSTQFNMLYAYELRINKGLVARAGISSGFTQRSINYTPLIFGDQIARGGASSSVEDLSTSRSVYFDMNAGYLMYSEHAWGGFAVNHLTRPNQSLVGGNSPLPVELNVHGGYKFLLEDDASNSKEQHSVTLAGNYKRQLRYNQIDVGAYYTKGYFVLGLWYRGIPLYKPYPWYYNNDAVVFLFGLSTDKLQIGYSFDYTVSKLHFYNTNGTHEISLSYPLFSKKKKKKKPILISCPKF